MHHRFGLANCLLALEAGKQHHRHLGSADSVLATQWPIAREVCLELPTAGAIAFELVNLVLKAPKSAA